MIAIAGTIFAACARSASRVCITIHALTHFLVHRAVFAVCGERYSACAYDKTISRYETHNSDGDGKPWRTHGYSIAEMTGTKNAPYGALSLATMLELLRRHVALGHETGLAEDRLSAFLDWTGLERHLAC